jgi:protein-tyrosine phosphatase
LLPELDDGARSLEESLEMARLAAAQGVISVVATPHHLNGRYTNPASVIRQAVDDFNCRLKQEQIPLQVYPGQEIHVTSNLINELDTNQLLPLGNTHYMLLELPLIFKEQTMLELFHELKVRQFIPVIAHPERHPELIRNTALMAEFVEYGVLGQVTSHSLQGRFGMPVRRSALRMCREGLIHLMASDAHNPYRRGCDLKETYQSIVREMGQERLLMDLPVNGAGQTKRSRKIWFF